MSSILRIHPLGFPWPTVDPFLFCVYHDDLYPRGNAAMGPDASLAGRNIGQDFEGIDGWRMYHGETVPGFPSHPHRGFETVTIVRKGLIDHSDSLGATARFGGGDVQWLTAGKGIVHSEMFPLLNQGGNNPLELFQIWLNLPGRLKMVEPHFTMLWAEKIPQTVHTDAQGRSTWVSVVAGMYAATASASAAATPPVAPLAPPPDSWAAQPEADVAIWTLKMQNNAVYTLPRAQGGKSRRMLYFFKGSGITVAGQAIPNHCAIELNAQQDVEICNGAQDDNAPAEFLVLQGQPIAEPVAQYGPFVMNTQAEIHQAFADYRRTEFGGWPFSGNAPVHARDVKRFARHADGVVESAAVV